MCMFTWILRTVLSNSEETDGAQSVLLTYMERFFPNTINIKYSIFLR